MANGTVYVATGDGNVYSGASCGRLYALDTATGSVAWTFTTGGPISASPSIVGDDVYVGDFYGSVYRISGCRPTAGATRCR